MQERIDYRKINFESARKYFEGKNVVFTGRGFLVRGELMRLARQAGAIVDSVVTKKCDILIVGEKPGSKLRKARILGCEIISTSEFKSILEGATESELYNIDKNKDILNINISNDRNNIDITGKKILVLINNNILKQKVIRIINENNGELIEEIYNNIDMIVYQPISEIYIKIENIDKRKIEILTIAQFNKLFY